MRDDPYRLAVGLIGAEAMLRLFTEQEANERAFGALTRFLDLLDEAPRRLAPDLDALGLSFQLKLLWLSGYLPHVGSCAECGSEGPLAGYSAAGGRGGLRGVRGPGALALSADGLAGMTRAPAQPARRRAHGRADRARGTRGARRDHVVVRGARRLPAADAARGMMRELEDGYELDDDPDRIDVDAVHAYLTRSYWAEGRTRETVELLVRSAQRVVGLYAGGDQVGFCRAVSDDASLAYLADVYVLPEHRGRGLGAELVREMIDNGPYAGRRWLLHTRDAHELYRRFGFEPPNERLMERPPAL